MTRRHFVHFARGREGNPISLFPFLAVLICTMGTLILLLVVLVRQVRLQAKQRLATHETPITFPSPQELTQLREDLLWQQEQIRAARQATQEQLNQARALLGHAEDSIRRLRAELAALQRSLQSLSNPQGIADAEALKRQVQETEQEIASLEQQLAERDKASEKRTSYAVIPYMGKHGTSRRPIYLECRGDKIVLQPEGIEFVLPDFLGPLGPGNPLDAALRAAREHLVRSGRVDPTQGADTYPLLLVRPDGIEAFYAARAALTSWGTEFGYELIEAEWEIAYPPPDAELASAVREAVKNAHERQEFLVQAAPGRYGRGLPKYRVAPYLGGAVPEHAISEHAVPEDAVHENNVGTEIGTGRGLDRRPEGSPPGFAALVDQPDSTDRETSRAADTPDAIAGADGRVITPQPAVGNRFTDEHEGIPGQLMGSAENQGQVEVEGKTSASISDGRQGEGGQVPSSSLTSSRRPGFAPIGADVQRTEQGIPGSQSRQAAGAMSASNGSRYGGGFSTSLRPLADSRGTGWAIPGHDRDAIPVTRPIRVECYPDRIVLVPEKGLDTAKVLPLDEGLEAAVDRLIPRVNTYIESWGIAGRGMYWRPVLNIRVAPGAEAVVRGMQILLKDSGLEIEVPKR